MTNAKHLGATLIETVAALFILSVGLLGLAGLQTTAIKNNLDTAQHSQATWITNELAERMRANAGNLSATYTNISNAILACTSPPQKYCADSSSQIAQSCNASEIAAFDIWDVFCGQGEIGDATTMTNSQSLLRLNSASITCNDIRCDQDLGYTITVAWESQATTSSQRLNQQGTTSKQKNQSIQMLLKP